jgi:4,5-DOPA dioxygenase extradiol
MPAVFVGHGNPMNAIERNAYSAAWRALGEVLPRPRAIVVVSAHWYIEGVAVTAMVQPRTIHDFYGFPPQLYEVVYPAPGDPELAAELIGELKPLDIAADGSWGLDHGAWSVLVHMYPSAEVPVVQLAIDARQPPRYHWDVGARLNFLRERGVLVLASGNIVHNLQRMDFNARSTADWAARFDAHVWEALQRGDRDALVDYSKHADARMAVPTPDHYYPLLYVAGLRREDEPISSPVDGFDAGSISMRAVRVG